MELLFELSKNKLSLNELNNFYKKTKKLPLSMQKYLNSRIELQIKKIKYIENLQLNLKKIKKRKDDRVLIKKCIYDLENFGPLALDSGTRKNQLIDEIELFIEFAEKNFDKELTEIALYNLRLFEEKDLRPHGKRIGKLLTKLLKSNEDFSDDVFTFIERYLKNKHNFITGQEKINLEKTILNIFVQDDWNEKFPPNRLSLYIDILSSIRKEDKYQIITKHLLDNIILNIGSGDIPSTIIMSRHTLESMEKHPPESSKTLLYLAKLLQEDPNNTFVLRNDIINIFKNVRYINDEVSAILVQEMHRGNEKEIAKIIARNKLRISPKILRKCLLLLKNNTFINKRTVVLKTSTF